MLSMIVCYDARRHIGKDDELLVKIPADLKKFRQRTLGCNIIMGRKTFESLPGLLPHRIHWVITRDKDYVPKYPGHNVKIFHSKQEVLDEVKRLNLPNVYIIGGGQIYEEFMDECDCIHATVVHKILKGGNVSFPKIKSSEWAQSQDGKIGSWKNENGDILEYTFQNFYRKKNNQLKHESKFNKVL